MLRNLVLATRARRYGANYSLRIITEARRAGIPVSLGFAIVEQESGFRNVFGHDPVRNPVKGGQVTKASYLRYRGYRDAGLGMQGVGPTQLTWKGYQDAADKLGGAWKPRWNIAVSFQALAQNITRYGLHNGVKAYNGTGPAAEEYAKSVLARQAKWHTRLA